MPAKNYTIVITPSANEPFGYRCAGASASSLTVHPEDSIIWKLASSFAKKKPGDREPPAFAIVFTGHSPFQGGKMVITSAKRNKPTAKRKVKKLLPHGCKRCPYKVVVAVGDSEIWIDDPEIQVDCE